MPLLRWWIAFALACALVGAQSLAFVHRVVHLGHSPSVPAAARASVPSLAPAATWADAGLAALFVGHEADGPVCHLFDAAAEGGMPALPVALPVLAPALLALPAPSAGCAQRPFRLFDARGPPAGY